MNNQQFNQTSRLRTSATRTQHVRDGQTTDNFPIHGRILQQLSLKDRVKESFPAVVIGTVLIICGAALLFWNEVAKASASSICRIIRHAEAEASVNPYLVLSILKGEAVHTARTLDEGYNTAVQVSTADYINVNNDGKLVHIYGALSSITPLQDSFYGIKVKAVSLKRRVQIYQWVEEESSFTSNENTESSDSSSYSYSQLWKDKLVDSSSFYIPFGHENPTSTPVPSVIQTAEVVKIGAYNLSPAIKETFTKFVPFSGDEQPDTDDVKLHNGMYYFTKDIFSPEAGDVRVQFYFAGHDGEVITLIGKQSGNTLHPYVTTSGRELLIVRVGKFSVEEMFSSEHAQNRLLTWLYRLFGWFLLFIGVTSISSIVQYMVTLSPLFRDVIFLGLGSANLTLSMSLSLLLIGGAWTFYRPTLAFTILIVAAFPLLRASLRRRSSPRSRGGERGDANGGPLTGDV